MKNNTSPIVPNSKYICNTTMSNKKCENSCSTFGDLLLIND